MGERSVAGANHIAEERRTFALPDTSTNAK